MLKYSQHHWKRHLSLSQISKKNDDVGDNSLDGNLLRCMDCSTHHDMFASLIAANNLTVSTTRYVAVFLFFIFIFAHCTWQLFWDPCLLLWSLETLYQESGPQRFGIPQIMLQSVPVELVGKIPLLRRSYYMLKMTLFVSILTPLSLFTFTQTKGGMLVLSAINWQWQFAKSCGGASLVHRNCFTFPTWWD